MVLQIFVALPSSTPRFLSWLVLPGETLIPTKRATGLEGICWYWIVTSCRSPPWLSGTCTPRCFNIFREWWVCSPVSFMGRNVDCWPLTSWKGVSLLSRLILLLFTNIASASRISPGTLGEISFKAVMSCQIYWRSRANYLLLLWIFPG